MSAEGNPEQTLLEDKRVQFLLAVIGTLIMALLGVSLALTPFCHDGRHDVHSCAAPWLPAWAELVVMVMLIGIMGGLPVLGVQVAVGITTAVFWFRRMTGWRGRPILFLVALLGFLLTVCLPLLGLLHAIEANRAEWSRPAAGL